MLWSWHRSPPVVSKSGMKLSRCSSSRLPAPPPALKHPPAAGLPVAVTLGKVTVSSGGATIRFTHAPWYSQGLQARVLVWNPIGADGKLLAAGKEVEETLPAPTNANAGIIPAGAGALTRVVGAACACIGLGWQPPSRCQ